MATALGILAAINLIALIVLAAGLLRLQRISVRLATELSALAPPAAAMADYEQALGPQKSRVIAVEILNPLELAAKESWFGEVFGNLSPSLIRNIVYQRTQKILVDKLLEYGVQADVKQYGD